MENNIKQPFSRYCDIIDDYDAFCDALKRPLPVTLWSNPERIKCHELRDVLIADGYSPEPLSWYPDALKLPENQRLGKHWGFLSGLFQLQEEAAMLPTRILNAQPGETVLDMCAAPGNKSAQLAFDMKNCGTLYANEMNRRRLASLKETCERLGLRNVSLLNLNGTNIPKNSARFDRILVDVPCSCEGTTRKHPELQLQADPEISLGLQGVQAALLRKAIQLCKPGGRIVYSTCTYAPEENECILNQVLSEFSKEQLTVIPAETFGMITSSGLTQWQEETFPESFKHCVRVWPHQNDTGGFFVAAIQVNSDESKEDVDIAKHPVVTMAQENDGDNLVHVLKRYGIRMETIEKLTLFKANSKETHCLSNQHMIFDKLPAARHGLHLLNHKKKPVKPSHFGALAIGAEATKNIITLTDTQIYPYMKREKVHFTPEQLFDWDSESELIVKYKGHCVGLGHLHTNEEGQQLLCSHVPKKTAQFLL